jgi:hypothetical protein
MSKNKIDIEDHQNEFFYYNATVENNSDYAKQIVLNDNRQVPLINRGIDWQLSIIRMNFNGHNIPIFVTRSKPNLTDVNILDYSITMVDTNNNNTATANLLMSNNFTGGIPIPNDPTYVKNNIDFWQYYSIYTFDQFITMVNTAFLSCFNTLATKPTGVTAAPYIMLDSTSGNLAMIYQEAYNFPSSGTGMHVFFSASLLEKLRFPTWSINLSLPNSKYAGIITDITNVVYSSDFPKGTNKITIPTGKRGAGTPGLYTTTEFPVLSAWSDLESIVLKSNIPVYPQIISNPNSNGQLITEQILVDFKPVIDSSTFPGSILCGTIEYLPTAQFKMMDIFSTSSISNIKIEWWWSDGSNLYPILMDKHDKAGILIMFKRKQKKSQDDHLNIKK